MNQLQETDPEIYDIIVQEKLRQEYRLEMIASENFTSSAVMEAQGSILTNKYAEGYPGHRYYGGCSNVDIIEEIARTRAARIFGVDHANVQPHSGTQANMAVFFSVMEPGATYLGMDLTHGGHLSMGHPKNFSGKIYRVVPYSVRREDHLIDYDMVRALAIKHRPRMIIAGASAYPRIIDYSIFGEIAREVDAVLMADVAHIAGLVVTGLHPSPAKDADFVTTTTHKTLRGPRGGIVMCKKKWAPVLDSCIFPGMQGGPLMHVIAAKAVALKEAAMPQFREYQSRVVKNAKTLAEELMNYGFKIVSGGTDNHLVLVDLTNKNVNGAQAQDILEAAGITVNKNAIPFDPLPPGKPSGIRIGTPAITTRRMGTDEIRIIASWISEAIENRTNESVIRRIGENVRELCVKFPLYMNGKGGV